MENGVRRMQILRSSSGSRLDSAWTPCAVRRSPDIDSAQVEAFFVWIWARSGPVRTSPMWSLAKDEEMDAYKMSNENKFPSSKSNTMKNWPPTIRCIA